MGAYVHEEPLDPHLVARLITARDSPDFAQQLLSAAQKFDAVREVFAYRLSGHKITPSVLLSSSGLDGAVHRVAMWVSDFHAIDPLTTASNTATGSGYIRCVRASEIYNPIYREICYENPRFANKLSFVWHQHDQSLVLNFYRGQDSQQGLSTRLQMLANLGLAAMAQRITERNESGRKHGRDVAWINVRIATRFPQLTPRECQVCAHTVAGWSAQAIAASLGIAMATVLTYRQRAYVRLNFSRASDFLPSLLD